MARGNTGRRAILTGMASAATLALGGCMRLGHRVALRHIVLRLPPESRAVFWEKLQKYAAQNGLASDRVPQQAQTARSFAFLLRGRGLEIVGRNNAYDPLQPNDYAVAFYGSDAFAAGKATVDRFAETFLATMLNENSVKLISDS